MKKTRYNLITGFCLLISITITAQVETETASSVDEIPKDVYFAHLTKEQNSNTWFPDLAYWGVQKINWSMSKNDLKREAHYETKGLNVFSKKTALYKKDFIEEITFSSNTTETQIIQYELTHNSTDKNELLSLFNKIMEEANLSYHSPTTYVSQPQIINGEDGFLNSIISEYKVEWSGKRTKIVLTVNNSKVSLVYLPVKGNDFSELEELSNKI